MLSWYRYKHGLHFPVAVCAIQTGGRTMKKSLQQFAVFCLAAALLLSLCGCAQEETDTFTANFANTVMKGDAFAYRDGFIYFSEMGNMYEYDTETGVTAKLGSMSDYVGRCLTVAEDKVMYYTRGMSDTSVHYITRDGKNSGVLFRRDDITSAFLEGDVWYILALSLQEDVDGFTYQLLSRDAETGEETLLLEADWINSYFVDEEYIYVVEIDTVGYDNEGKAIKEYWLLRSPKDQIAFEKVDTTIKPIKVFANGDDLYICQWGDWQIWHYADGVANALPMTSFNYQVFDGHLLYQDSAPGVPKYDVVNGPFGDPLKAYNLETGEEKVLAESVFYFAILGERYVAYGVNLDGANFRWYVYDWQTGETKEMVKPV